MKSEIEIQITDPELVTRVTRCQIAALVLRENSRVVNC